MFELYFLVTVAMVSLPETLRVAEEVGSVLVCALLSVNPMDAVTANAVTVTLATTDTTPSGKVLFL